MTEPEPTQPEPADDPGHILTPEQWAAVEAERTQRLIDLGVLDENGDPIPEAADPNLGGDDA